MYNTLFLFQLDEERLKALPRMKHGRSHHGFVTFRASLWAIGGSNGKETLNAVESYDPI